MTIERPMFPPRAESVDSFSHQSATGQRKKRIRTSESRKPAEAQSPADQPNAIVSFPKSKRPLPADRPSAISGVKKSGLKLVAVDLDGSTGEPATHEQLAALEFEPWVGRSEGTEALTGENWLEHRVSVIFAHATMFMSKDKLIDIHRTVDPDHVDQLMANIFETAEWLKGVAAMMEGAQIRLLAAACAAVDEGVIGDGTLPLHIADVRSTPRIMGL